jgi:hypothetical protein
MVDVIVFVLVFLSRGIDSVPCLCVLCVYVCVYVCVCVCVCGMHVDCMSVVSSCV